MAYQINNFTIIDDNRNVVDAQNVVGFSAAGGCIPTILEVEAGELDNHVMTPLRMRNAIRATGSAPTIAARAWLSFSATTPTAGVPTIIGSGNISSITDLGLGNFRANFTTPMPVNSYVVVGSTDQKTVSSLMICIGPTANTFSTNSFEFRAKGRIFSGSSDWIDPIHASLTVFS